MAAERQAPLGPAGPGGHGELCSTGLGKSFREILDSLLDSLHRDGEEHSWEPSLKKLLDLSEQ